MVFNCGHGGGARGCSINKPLLRHEISIFDVGVAGTYKSFESFIWGIAINFENSEGFAYLRDAARMREKREPPAALSKTLITG